MRKNLSEWGSFYWVVPAVVFSLLIVVWVDRKKRHRKVLWAMVVIWAAGVTYLLFIYRLPRGYTKISWNFFHMFQEAGRYNGSLETNQALRQILFNILLYVPLGCVLASLTGKIWLSILIGVVISIFTESLQYWLRLGMADIDDVISNTIGLLAGVFIYKGINRVLDTR